MKKTKATYWFVYIATLIVAVTAVFFDKYCLIYTKPIAILAIILLYVTSVSKINLLFLLSMVVIIVNDTYVNMDFLRYFEIVAVLISIFYLLCILLLRKFISRKDLKIKKLISVPVFVSCILVFYLIYSITQITLPRIDNSIGYVLIIVISVLAFSAPCFIIYINDRYEKSIYLFIAASCTIFVDLLLAVNELYYYNRVFTVLINVVEILGIYSFASFFIETKLKEISKDKLYF